MTTTRQNGWLNGAKDVANDVRLPSSALRSFVSEGRPPGS